MANYANLKTAIQQTIKQNGNEEITGAILQTTLLSMVDSLASGHLFKGIARPLFAPATTEGPAFYIALEAGSYINFTLTELGATAILREGYFGIFKTSGGSSNWTFTEVAISIKDGIVTTSKISNGAVTTDKIENGSITNDKINDNAVSTQKIAPNAVTYNKIAVGAVGTDKIADEAVTTDKIADDSITEQKLQSDSVNETAIQSDSIYERHIVDNEVTKRKLGQDVIEELENKANIDGSYESMSVGMAKNVEGTSPISGIFTFRPTAGNGEVASGVARTLKIGGNAIPWNQILPVNWAQSGSVGNVTYTINSDGSITLNGEVGESNRNFGANIPLIVNGHTYYYSAGSNNADIRVSNALQNSEWGNAFIINNISNKAFYIVLKAGASFSNYKIYPQIYDLTLMFGAGNEPSSVAAFETWLQNNIGLQTYYPYNEGKLLAAKLLGLRTVWLNQWDEEWEAGAYSQEDGEKITDADDIRSKNYIKVISGASYYCKKGQKGIGVLIFTYDSNKNFVRAFVAHNQVFTLNMNEEYITMCTYGAYGSTYNHDICINLHYTNGRDGEYEPYVEHQYNFDTSKVYGKLNGEGNLVQVSPDGMRSAGTAHDVIDITKREAVVNVGYVALKNLPWIYDSNNQRFHASISGFTASISAGLLSSHYTTKNDVALDYNIMQGSYYNFNQIILKDSRFTTSEDLLQYLTDNNVLLYFQLATPLVYTDLVYRDNGVDKPIDALNILVSNYGTEEQIVESPTNGEPNSCAAALDILYGVNAADFMDAANNGAFVSKASMESFLNTLGNAMNGVWSAVWNSSTGKYDFSFTPNAALQNENLNND